jgi:predicted phosphoserine aminotransferase
LSRPPILFTPGPTQVRPEVLEAFGSAVISHRGAEMVTLIQEILPGIRRIFETREAVLLSSSSASGLMEGAIRNCVSRRCLHLISGAFGERWRQVAADCGREPESLRVEAGDPISPEAVEEALSKGNYEAVCLTHNETATGVTHPLADIAQVVRNHEGVLLMVDAVSSLGGIPVAMEANGIDVCFASVQKALALPPGFSLCSVSQRALEKSRVMPGRGYYFDFVRLAEASEKGQPLATPSVSHLMALKVQLQIMLQEGMENRYARHAAMGRRVREWAREHFGVLAKSGFESNTVTCVTNRRGIQVADFIQKLKLRGYQISNGYGNLKEATFRIGHMGEHTLERIEELLHAMDEVLAT